MNAAAPVRSADRGKCRTPVMGLDQCPLFRGRLAFRFDAPRLFSLAPTVPIRDSCARGPPAPDRAKRRPMGTRVPVLAATAIGGCRSACTATATRPGAAMKAGAMVRRLARPAGDVPGDLGVNSGDVGPVRLTGSSTGRVTLPAAETDLSVATPLPAASGSPVDPVGQACRIAIRARPTALPGYRRSCRAVQHFRHVGCLSNRCRAPSIRSHRFGPWRLRVPGLW